MPTTLRSSAVVAALLLITGCGTSGRSLEFSPTESGDAPSSTLATPPPTTMAPRPSTTATVPATASRWIDVTGNLTGVESECGTLSLVSASSDRDMVIAGVARQGLWTSEAGSDRWTPLGRGDGSATVDNRPSSITYDPDHPTSFWVSGTYGAGVFHTEDGGNTLRRLGTVEHSDFVSVDLGDPKRQTLLSGTHEQRKVLRSLDGGKTWVDISAGLPSDIGVASFPHVVDANTYLLGTKSAEGAGVFRTTDRGRTWSLVHAGGISGPAMVSSVDGDVYWLYERGNGLITSSDGGETWTDVNAPGPDGGTAGSIIELPDGRFATLGSSGVLISADRGAHWRSVGPGLPFVPAGLTYSPSRQAFYAWHFDCDNSSKSNPVSAGSIVRLDVDIARL
jgi:photosystem II stability/assembly factor-like uncharacterized protein